MKSLQSLIRLPFSGFTYLVIFLVIVGRIRLRNIQVSADLTPANAAELQQKQKILARRYKNVKMLFVSYVWYTMCLLPAPLGATLFTAAYSSLPLLQLLLRALLLLGYATIPVCTD